MRGRSDGSPPGERRLGVGPRVYRRLLRMLPPGTCSEDATAIAQAFEDQLAHAAGAAERSGVLARAFMRLPKLFVLEWLDALGLGSTGAIHKDRRGRESGMWNLMRSGRYAARTLIKNPAFAAATVLLVGLGVGAVTAVFTIVDNVLLRPLPYPSADRLVYLTNGSHNGATLEGLRDIDAFDMWTAVSGNDVNLTLTGAAPLRLNAIEVTPSFFTMFGAGPAVGRLLIEDDYRDLAVTVITHEAWQTIWGSDPRIVGSTIRINGSPVAVVGVLSEDFVLPETLVGNQARLFMPMDWNRPALERPGYHAHSVAARLAPGVPIETGDAQIEQLARRVADRYPDYYSDGPDSWPLQYFHERTVQDVSTGLLLLLGSVAVLLLVACANVAHLFLARGLSRGRELAIRQALGAGTRALLSQLLVESLMVGLLGGLIGLGLAKGALGGFARWMDGLPRSEAIALDPRVFGFALLLAALTALLFGLLPAFRTAGRDISDALRQTGVGSTSTRGVNFTRGSLVVGEVALSLVLVALAGLLMRSFVEVSSQDPGYEVDGIWVVPLNLTGVESSDDYRLRMGEVQRALEAVPGVSFVTYGIEAPFEWTGGNACCWGSGITDPDDETRRLQARNHTVTAGHFDTYGTEIVAGEVWGEGEGTNQPTPVVVTEQLAVRFFGSAEAAVGRELPFGSVPRIIRGVAEPTLHYGLDQSHDYGLFLPIEALPFAMDRAAFGLRVATNDGGFAGRVRDAIWSVEPELPIPTVVRLQTWIDESSSTRRLGSALSASFGFIALMLAAGGLYGTLLYAVGERRKELGIRLALGAGRARIQGQVVRRGLRLAIVGVVVGVFGAWAVGRLVESFLFGVSAHDPVALTTAAGVLLTTAVLASWLPANRASRTDPLETLRTE